MKANLVQSPHLDDQTLQMILESDPESASPFDLHADEKKNTANAEDWVHFQQCEQCQSRLVEVAAAPEIREQLSSVLRETGESNSGIAPGRSLDHNDNIPRLSQGQEYKSIEQSLNQWLDPASHPELMGRLDRYEVESILGWGGMGVVLKAQDSELRRPVAIKMLLPRWADNGSAKQRFLREARSAAAVLHPSVIAIHGIHQHQDMPYLVMPLVVGPSLQQLVQKAGPLAERQVVQIGLQVASGLAAAHCQGVIHRDIKPGNVLLDNSVNRAVITDFGLARCQDDQVMTQTGWMAGTPGYMSPEQCRGEELDGRSDLFSLGAVLFFLCTGQSPFRGDSPMAVLHQITNGRATDVRRINEEVTPALAGLIDRLLKPKKENRFTNAAELEVFLQRYLQHLHAPTTKKRPRLISQRRWMLPVASLVAIVAFSAWWVLPGWLNEKPSQPAITGSTGENRVVKPRSKSPVNSLAGVQAEIGRRYQLTSEEQWQTNWQQLNTALSKPLQMEPIQLPDIGINDELPSLNQLQSELDELQQSLNTMPSSWPVRDGVGG